MKQQVVEVLGRHIKRQMAWIRVKYKQYGWRILTLPDSVIPHGMKTATHLLVEWDGEIETRDTGYYADLTVLEDVSDQQGARTPEEN